MSLQVHLRVWRNWGAFLPATPIFLATPTPTCHALCKACKHWTCQSLWPCLSCWPGAPLLWSTGEQLNVSCSCLHERTCPAGKKYICPSDTYPICQFCRNDNVVNKARAWFACRHVGPHLPRRICLSGSGVPYMCYTCPWGLLALWFRLAMPGSALAKTSPLLSSCRTTWTTYTCLRIHVDMSCSHCFGECSHAAQADSALASLQSFA